MLSTCFEGGVSSFLIMHFQELSCLVYIYGSIQQQVVAKHQIGVETCSMFGMLTKKILMMVGLLANFAIERLLSYICLSTTWMTTSILVSVFWTNMQEPYFLISNWVCLPVDPTIY